MATFRNGFMSYLSLEDQLLCSLYSLFSTLAKILVQVYTEMIIETLRNWDVPRKGSAVEGRGGIAGGSTRNFFFEKAFPRWQSHQPLSGRVDNQQYRGTEEMQTLNTITEGCPKSMVKTFLDIDPESQFIAGI